MFIKGFQFLPFRELVINHTAIDTFEASIFLGYITIMILLKSHDCTTYTVLKQLIASTCEA